MNKIINCVTNLFKVRKNKKKLSYTKFTYDTKSI